MNPQDSSTSLPPMAAQDPLAQLQDIHLPDDISWWPPAIGWWLLLIVLIAVTAGLIFLFKRKRNRNAYRAIALAEIHKAQAIQNNAEYLQALSVILRRTALSGLGNEFNASLKGQAWLEWLDDHCVESREQFSQGVGRALLIGPYQKNPDYDRAALHQLAVSWIKLHRNQWQAKKIKKTSEAKHHV